MDSLSAPRFQRSPLSQPLPARGWDHTGPPGCLDPRWPSTSIQQSVATASAYWKGSRENSAQSRKYWTYRRSDAKDDWQLKPEPGSLADRIDAPTCPPCRSRETRCRSIVQCGRQRLSLPAPQSSFPANRATLPRRIILFLAPGPCWPATRPQPIVAPLVHRLDPGWKSLESRWPCPF